MAGGNGWSKVACKNSKTSCNASLLPAKYAIKLKWKSVIRESAI